MTTDNPHIPELVRTWASRTPDAVALESSAGALTYRQLHDAAAAAAARISRWSVPGDVVAVEAAHTAETVVAILAALQAGCTYLPLDFDAPATCAEILERVTPTLLISAGPAPECAQTIHRTTIDTQDTAPHAGRAFLPGSVDVPAYLMPTSGSTGTTKIVEVGHRNVCYNVRALNETIGGITSNDAYLHFASFAFSSSVRQLFLPLSRGARVVLAASAERRDPAELLRRVRASKVTVVDVIPSLLAVLLDAAEATDGGFGTDLRLLLTASERLPGELVRRWHPLAPAGCRFFNMYGQTETTGIVSVHPVTAADAQRAVVPIGQPIPETSLTLVGSAGAPVPPGGIAEIVVTGPGLARGYAGDPGRTAAAFPVSAASARTYRTGDLGRYDGQTLRFAGRRDAQVKVRGHRVDLTEVELMLSQHPAVAEAVVVDIGNTEVRVAAAVQLRPGHLDAAVLQRLRELPDGPRVLDLNPPETDFMFDEIFTREVYLQHGIVLPRDACVIDAGANIGLFTLFAARRAPHGRIIAVEPAGPAAETLRINLAANGCTNAVVREVALGDHRGTATLTFYPHSVGMSSIHADPAREARTISSIIGNQVAAGDVPGELREVTGELADAKLVPQKFPCTLTRLSDMLTAEAVEHVDLLKIDVQDSELDLLAGIDDADWLRIAQVVAEAHDVDGRLARTVALLRQRGFHVATAQDAMFAGTDMYYVYARRPGYEQQPAQRVRTTASTPALPRPVTTGQLLEHLRDRLPDHHVPVLLLILTQIPHTSSGKADRPRIADALRAHLRRLPQQVGTNDDPVVTVVAEVWREVLGRPVSAGDDFFEIGGNSLTAARVITRLRDRLGREIPLRLIFATPELVAFASELRPETTPPAVSPASGTAGAPAPDTETVR
ncbi:methyltransferase, FkbM family/amino acid adenylation domain-containing protein [Asanoa hainanensis]|uniref:Methyltransferase, FkbM family/amino acid adenylation domain-containing protein n=1 Tax=Asanoa hainanensis TaxID=560556 RepID=A0A239PH40_9ACTN|nr:amino acid adenylation domain-containing protein [Asanoa hainanensis]SNT65894.1 methyltransferase, FkbM family/amino acid adenylation domain-containing protein [Asanoa hainanensis]